MFSVSCGGSAHGDPPAGSPETSAALDGESPSRRPSEPASPLALRIARSSEGGNALRGARLYDNFYAENPDIAFTPSTAASTGSGGPYADGTLADGLGEVLDNTLRHDYRLSNLFGWDMRGTQGLYGPAYQDRAYVADFNLMDGSLEREQVAALVVDGERGIPAYGGVMPERDLADVVAFIMAVRGGELLQPGDVWHLDAAAPKGYVLKPGGRVELGQALIGAACGGCHGADGTSLRLGAGDFSLGSLARGKADEVWFKMLAGSAGTPMASQIPIEEPWPVQAQVVLDVLAALCDRTAYPPGASSVAEVPAGDGCGYYVP